MALTHAQPVPNAGAAEKEVVTREGPLKEPPAHSGVQPVPGEHARPPRDNRVVRSREDGDPIRARDVVLMQSSAYLNSYHDWWCAAAVAGVPLPERHLEVIAARLPGSHTRRRWRIDVEIGEHPASGERHDGDNRGVLALRIVRVGDPPRAEEAAPVIAPLRRCGCRDCCDTDHRSPGYTCAAKKHSTFDNGLVHQGLLPVLGHCWCPVTDAHVGVGGVAARPAAHRRPRPTPDMTQKSMHGTSRAQAPSHKDGQGRLRGPLRHEADQDEAR